MAFKVELHNHNAAGDTMCMTCAVRDLKRNYSDKYEIKPITNFPHMWDFNPYVSNFEEADIVLKVGPGLGVQGSNASGLHFCNAYRLGIEEKLNISIKQGPIRPDVHLSQEEMAAPSIIEGHYWLIAPGTRNQFTSKVWPYERWQEVVEAFPDITFVQIGLNEHKIPKLVGSNIIDFTGKTEDSVTGIRDLFKLCYHAQGGLSLVSFLMHLMAAFQKPCVVVAGAREPVSFEAYNFHRYLHNQGSMYCPKHTDITTSCWRTSVGGCTNRVASGHPKCLDIITPAHVIDAMNSYYVGGRLQSPSGNIITVKDTLCPEDDAIILTPDLLEEPDAFEVIVEKPFEVIHATEKGVSPIVTTTKKTIGRIFKMVCNAHGFGGGEKSPIWIMNRMLREGFEVQLVPTKGVSNDFRSAIPKVEITDRLSAPCDILMFYTNDAVFGFNEPKYDLFDKVEAKKKIMVLNYKLGKTGEVVWSKGWDLYAFLNTTISNEFSKKFSDEKVAVLAPPVDLEPFLKVDLGSLNKTLHLVRLSSQGDKKYSRDLNDMITQIRDVDPRCKFSFMPPPSFLDQSIVGVFRLAVNEVSVIEFLKKGTMFWYPLPEGYTDQGPRVIVEAMAVGLPVIADNRDGAKDRVTPETGWLCNSHSEYAEIIRNITGRERSQKGQAAKERARKEFDPEKWVKAILEI